MSCTLTRMWFPPRLTVPSRTKRTFSSRPIVFASIGLPLYVNAVLRAITTAPRMRERSVVRLSVTPSTKCSCSAPPPILANGKTTMERRGLRLGGRGHFKRIDADRLRNVPKLGWTEIADCEIEPPLHLTVGVLGETDCAGGGNALQPCGDIDAIAHQVAVRLLDHVAKVDAYAELDAALGLHAGVALGHPSLHFDRAAHGVDHATKLDNDAVASALDDAPAVGGDGRIDQIAAQAAQPRQSTIFVSPGEPAVTDDIGDQDCCEFPDLGHWTLGPSGNLTRSPAQSCRKALKDPRTPARPPSRTPRGVTAGRLPGAGRSREGEAMLAECGL